MVGLNRMTNTLYPELPTDSRKRARPHDEEDEETICEEDINAIVTILGNQLLIVKKSIMAEKGNYTL